jgi:hypothetical protein
MLWACLIFPSLPLDGLRARMDDAAHPFVAVAATIRVSS